MHRSASIYYRPNVDSIRSIRTSLYRPNVSCEQREASGLACMSIRMKMSPAIRINVIRHHTTIRLHKLKFTLWFFVECRAGLVIYCSTCLQTNLLRFNRYLSCTFCGCYNQAVFLCKTVWHLINDSNKLN